MMVGITVITTRNHLITNLNPNTFNIIHPPVPIWPLRCNRRVPRKSAEPMTGLEDLVKAHSSYFLVKARQRARFDLFMLHIQQQLWVEAADEAIIIIKGLIKK